MKALALAEAPDHVCYRYRIAAFQQEMARAGWELEVQGLQSGTMARIAQLRRCSRYDAVILQRRLLPNWQVSLLRQRAHKLIFDYDDAVLFRDSYDSRGPHSRRRSIRFGNTVRKADVVIAGNDFLADCAINSGARADRVRVIPTCIDLSLYPAHRCPNSNPIKMAWVGSSSTLQGLESQRALFERIGREIPDIVLRIVADRSSRFDPLNVEFVSWQQATEVASISGCDIGISWIPDDLWSRGKCGLKVLQYMAAGLPVVANGVGVHSKMILDGRTGFLADSADAWIAALKTLSNDPVLRVQMGREARLRVESDYAIAIWSSAFVAALSGSGSIPSSRPRTGPLNVRKADLP